MIRLGVILSVYQGDKKDYLEQAVCSILQQSFQDYIVFIGVDGPVNEDVKDYLHNLEGCPQIRLLWFQNNRGLAYTANDLIAEAKLLGCEYYARMDADDISVKDRFEKQIKFLESNPEVDVVGGAIEEINENSDFKGKQVVYPLTHIACKKFFRYRDPVAHPAVMFRNSFFTKVPNGYRKEYRKNQDTMLWLDGFINGCIFANLPDTVLLYRVTDDFFSSRRHGWKRAKKMLKDRLMINRTLHYDLSAYLFAMAMFFVTLMPPFIKKIVYRLR